MENIIENALLKYSPDNLAKEFVIFFNYEFGERTIDDITNQIGEHQIGGDFFLRHISNNFVPLTNDVISLLKSSNNSLYIKEENLCLGALYIYITLLIPMRKEQFDEKGIKLLEELFLLRIIKLITDCNSLKKDQSDNFFLRFFKTISK